MPSFRDAVANYKNKPASAPPALNPPEAVKVLETQTAPEVESPKAPPATVPIAPPPVAPLPSTPAVEESRRKRRTKAEMEAARAAEQVSSTPQGGPDSTTGRPAPVAPPATGDLSDFTTEELTSELARRGYSGTLAF